MDESRVLASLHDTLKDLAAQPMAGAAEAAAAMARAAEAPQAQRAQALRQAWLKTAEASQAIVARGMEQTQGVAARMAGSHPAKASVEKLHAALAEQHRGLGLMVAFLNGGERGLLEQATRAIQDGERAAQEAAQQAARLKADATPGRA